MMTMWRHRWYVVMIMGVLAFQGCSQEQKVSKNPETKTADDLFDRWIKRQNVFDDRVITSMEINDTFVAAVKQKYREEATALAPLNDLIESVFAGEIKGGELHITLNDALKRNLTYIYGLIENDMVGFADFLRHHGLESHDANRRDSEMDFHEVIKKYYGFMELLFAGGEYTREPGRSETYRPETEYLFSAANRFFEFFFGPTTWHHGKKMLSDPGQYPLARMFYATIWKCLSGTNNTAGWKIGCWD